MQTYMTTPPLLMTCEIDGRRTFLRWRQEVAHELHYSISSALREQVGNCSSPNDPAQVPRNNIKLAARIVEFCCGPSSLIGKMTDRDCEIVRLTEGCDLRSRTGCQTAKLAVSRNNHAHNDCRRRATQAQDTRRSKRLHPDKP